MASLYAKVLGARKKKPAVLSTLDIATVNLNFRTDVSYTVLEIQLTFRKGEKSLSFSK